MRRFVTAMFAITLVVNVLARAVIYRRRAFTGGTL